MKNNNGNSDHEIDLVRNEVTLMRTGSGRVTATPVVEARRSNHHESVNNRHGDVDDIYARFNARNNVALADAASKAHGTEQEFIGESLDRGFGVRNVVPIRSEELKAKAFKLGFVFALVLAFVLGAINANQVIDAGNIQLSWLLEFVVIAVVVGLSLLGFEFVSKAILTAVLDLGSFRNRGAIIIRRWFAFFGLAFVLVGVLSLWLRADTGLPEMIGIMFFMIWEWTTVGIAALCSLAQGYHGWSGDLARKYDAEVSASYGF